MLWKTMILLVVIDELLEHTVKNSRNCKETLDCRTNVIQSLFVTQNLLNNECCHCFWKSLSILHYPQAKRYNLCLHQESNGIWVTFFDKCSNNSKRCYSKIFKDLTFGRCVQKWVEEKRYMCFQEFLTSLRMQSQTLKKPNNQTNSVRTCKFEIRWWW